MWLGVAAHHSFDEAALRLVRCLARLPLAGDPLPGEPTDGAIEARQVKADGQWIGRGRRRPPLARCQHLRLVVLGDRLLAALAVIGRRLRLALFPLQPLELQPLTLTAV